jgi:LacI family transcriptional regulator
VKNPTIYDVARESGLSIKTVSRVMNRDPNVKAGNRERILAAAEALGYSPNLSARSLAGARSFLIAAFLDAELTMNHWQSGRASDYVSRLQLGAIRECRTSGYHFTLELIDHDPAQLTREVRDVLQALKPDGILLTPPSCDDPHMLKLLDAAQVRYARLGSDSVVPGGMQLPLGDRSGAASVTHHLIGLGHTRIAVITGPSGQSSSDERLVGFRQTMAASGVDVVEKLVMVSDFTFKSGAETMRALMSLRKPPTAVFAFNDEMALGCVATLSELGLECPRDVSIAGFDDSVGARFSRPKLTTVRQPLVEVTAEAVQRLMNPESYVEGLVSKEDACVLIVNDSTGPRAGMKRKQAHETAGPPAENTVRAKGQPAD